MNKIVANLAIKAWKQIMVLISAQLVKYLSSEEFNNNVKKLIKNMVEQLVKLVLSEKKVVAE